uniref:Uncharacterized protein n=1 Tax=Tanacetum cinerariifolium TaxID=118510 RepID=A0A6L2LCU6_TANCI|nr:hypothetical protein [Tanacetum cinerariifolium]
MSRNESRIKTFETNHANEGHVFRSEYHFGTTQQAASLHNGYLTEQQEHQLRLDEEALREALEEEANAKRFALCTIKSIPFKCRLRLSQVLKGALDKEESAANDIQSLNMYGGSLQLCSFYSVDQAEWWYSSYSRVYCLEAFGFQDTLVIRNVLESIIEDIPCCGLHLNVYTTEFFLPKEGPIRRLACVFPPNIARTLHGVKLLGGTASVEFDFSSELVMERVAKSIELVDTISKINDPRSELLLLRACVGIFPNYILLCEHAFSGSLSGTDVLLMWCFLLLWNVLLLPLDLDLVISNGDLLPYPLHSRGLTSRLHVIF